MNRIRICEEPEECRSLWKTLWPAENLFDLWAVRACFNAPFDRPFCFLVAENNGAPEGLLALSWIDEMQHYSHFPGETWQGRTWLEQNRIIAGNAEVRKALLEAVPGELHLRYLTRDSLLPGIPAALDETGYLFLPGTYGHDFGAYMTCFPGKSRKKLAREREPFERMGISFSHDTVSHVDLMFRMNLSQFGDRSYFSDPRFLAAFENLTTLLQEAGSLRVTTLRLGGTIAAVDMGAVVGRTYTVLAGGTNPDFPGAAKLINFHHMEWACRRRLDIVDFLCGEFGWKERFRLSPRPLFELRSPMPRTPGIPAPAQGGMLHG